MSTVHFFTPQYHPNPQSLRDSIQNFAEGYFDLSTSSCSETVLKVISYATVIFPLIALAVKAYFRCIASSPTIQAAPEAGAIQPDMQAVLDGVPEFQGYRIGAGTPYDHLAPTLTSATIRPANLFYNALLGPDNSTLPGSGQLFSFLIPHEEIRRRIMEADPEDTVAFTAAGTPGQIFTRANRRFTDVADLSELFGDATYRMSFGELQETLESQRIYTAPLLPLPFYRALKQAMQLDGMVILDGHDRNPLELSEVERPHMERLIADVRNRFADYGFLSEDDCENILELTLYQLGSLVVKSEDFRIFLDANGKIRERNPGEQDTIRLINACGIRGIRSTPRSTLSNRTIMKQTFQTAFQAAENGFVVFPAVGMGVWGGDPGLYWRAFFDAVIESAGPHEQIFVNPGHQPTPIGRYRGNNGNEFQIILNEYLANHAGNPRALANLAKIVNLYDLKTDLVHLSHELKVAFPGKIVSLFNASDPDVTLGFHVGEYVNNLAHANTTEENYTALGTNGLCFETITGIHQDPRRLIQAVF